VTSSRSPGGDGDEAPYFPLPRKREEPSPYRKAGAVAPELTPPVKEPVVVTRPEPPVPVVPVIPPRKTPKPVVAYLPVDPDALRAAPAPSSAARLLSKLVARHPRLFGAALSLLGGWLFASAALEDQAALEHATGALVRMHEAWYFQFHLAVAAAGAWLVACAIPIDERTDRPRDWWLLGLFIVMVLAVAARGFLEDGVVRLFGGV